jgi:uncharacterized membrane protein YoaT (DUF817 family)
MDPLDAAPETVQTWQLETPRSWYRPGQVIEKAFGAGMYRESVLLLVEEYVDGAWKCVVLHRYEWPLEWLEVW